MSSSAALREIFTLGRPLVEQWLEVGEQIAALRDVATAKGLDWSQVKALLKAQIQDELDETSDGKRVRRIVEKAEFASAYADMLGLGNMNEKKYSAELPDHDPATGEVFEVSNPDPHLPRLTTGSPNPSSDDAGAKGDGSPIAGQGGVNAGSSFGQSEHQDASAAQDRNEPISASGATVTLSPSASPAEKAPEPPPQVTQGSGAPIPLPAQESGGTALGESHGGKSNAARPASVDAYVNDGRLAGEVSNEVVTVAGTESGTAIPACVPTLLRKDHEPTAKQVAA